MDAAGRTGVGDDIRNNFQAGFTVFGIIRNDHHAVNHGLYLIDDVLDDQFTVEHHQPFIGTHPGTFSAGQDKTGYLIVDITGQWNRLMDKRDDDQLSRLKGFFFCLQFHQAIGQREGIHLITFLVFQYRHPALFDPAF